MRISIIHPSRHRAKLAIEVADKWLSKAKNSNEIEYIFSIDEDDIQRELYEQSGLHVLMSPNKSAIEAINNAAKQASGDLFIVVSDDFDCPHNWDVTLLSYLKDKRDFVVKTWDGLQPWIMTLPIMDRVYYERFGYIYYPNYKHMFCDTEMTHVGDLLNKTIIVPMVFPHNHYTQKNGIPKDAISQKNDNTWAQGEKLYLERIYRNFDIPEKDLKGVLRCNKEHLSWLQSKGINFEIV